MASLTKINKVFNLIKDETQHQNYSESILFCNLVNFTSKLENPNTVFFNSWFELDGEDNFFEYSAAEYLEDLLKLKDFIHSLSSVQKVEILPYHDLGRFKWEELGLKYELDGVSPATPEDVARAKKILEL